ncbi:AAA family ATPase [Brevundimonas sp.]|uniref:AAA family ATPase n=1 Tax=Brevundimonas sp. TaxID=1871086 RepID=UPI003F705799
MKLLSIELEDIFVYRGKSVIDLSQCTPERNLVIVQGRNGHGKTSLLNAVKLLFVGATDKRLLKVGFGQVALTPKQFVVGQQGRWDGVFNRIARESELPARVALTWESDEDGACRAERIFFPLRGGVDYREQLTVALGHRTLEGSEARQYLQGLLPREVVPFFFFDGEEIQSLADAEVAREKAEIERLLGLYFVSHLTPEIDAYAKEKRKAGLPEDAQLQIAQAEGLERTARLTGDAAERARVELEEEIADLDRERVALDKERAALRNGLSEEERQRLEGRIAVLREEAAELGAKIATVLPVEAPAVANLPLARQAFGLLETQLDGGANAGVAARVHKAAPDAVVAALAALDERLVSGDDRQVAVRKAVRKALSDSGLDEGQAENPLFASLSPRKLRALRDRFLVWTDSGETLASTQAAQLQRMRQIAHEEAALVQELEESELTSEESRARYAELTAELKRLDDVVREKTGQAALQQADETRARKAQAQHAEDARRLYASFPEVVALNAAYQLALKTKRALEAYRAERRRLIRASLEARLRSRIEILMGPTQLVKSVRLDDNFLMTYLDALGEPVARYSLSAGMRQLAAMSMLWALKDETKRPLPVVIDTPLGRIDRENREILMHEYFPAAGMPLVVLPTNTEMSADDLALLEPHIAMRYEIRNDEGIRSKIEPVAPRGQRAGGAHG